MRGKFGLMVAGAAVAAMALAGCASTGSEPVDARNAETLAGLKKTGEKTECLMLTNLTSLQGVDERTLLARVGVSRYYVNKLNGRCTGITRSSNRIQYQTTTARLCRNEIITVIDNVNGFVSGSCSLGSFEELTPIVPDPAAVE